MRSPVKAIFCSKLAIATALVVGATPVAAQTLQGTIDSSVGIGAIAFAPGGTSINVTSSQAVINWTATGPSSGGSTTFQSAGTTATFYGTNNFAVLNRVSPTVSTDAILMNGTINSLVNGLVGGTVYFYSPNGIIIGDSARFNVGSLGLTTSPIADVAGVWMSGFGTSSSRVDFAQANAGSFIRTDGLAELNANGAGTYVALVAPRIEHGGTIRTDGGAALVGAAGATITFRTNNLYDIEVTTGSADGNGVVVGGGTIERNSPVIGGDRRAYLVAVPANDAMTLLVYGGATLGFDIAGSAGVEGNAVVLSAGGNIYGGDAVAGAGQSDVEINSSTVTSDLFVDAGQSILLHSYFGASLYTGNVTLTAPTLIRVHANLNDLIINGNLTAIADLSGFEGASVEAGDIEIQAFNGNLLQMASADLSAVGVGGSVSNGLLGGDGKGGDILVQAASGGSIEIGGALDATANGEGGQVFRLGGTGGNGTGGTVRLLANGGNSNVTVGGKTYLQAQGIGGTTGSDCTSCEVSGGKGFGGTINVNGATGSGNTLNLADLWMFAIGQGGDGDGLSGGGDGYGGQSNLGAADGTVVTVSGTLLNFADGAGGNGLVAASGGNGFGGNAGIGGFGVAGGQINLNGTGSHYVTAEAVGGTGGFSGGSGGNATGGTASVSTNGTGIDVNGRLYVRSDARGGNAASGTGGSAAGGQSYVNASGNDLIVDGRLILDAYGNGGQGLSGGSGSGGLGQLILSGGSASIGNTTTINAQGRGGAAVGDGGNGGEGIGGTARIYGSSGVGTFTGAVLLDVGGTGGAGALGIGGDGTGGQARFNADGATFAAMSNLTLQSISTGGDGASGGHAVAQPSTAATPTDARILAGNGGTITVAGAVLSDASAYGGDGSNGSGGNATAGRAEIFVDWGSVTLGNVEIAADGFGGNGGNGGAGGNGRGGLGSAGAWGTNIALLSASDIDVTAEGTGGAGGAGIDANVGGAGGAGGTGIGGTTFIIGSAANGTLIVTGDSLALAGGYGGDGGDGGSGDSGAGGSGGDGGAGGGGFVQLGTVSNPTAVGTSGGATYAAVSADSSAAGGGGGNGGSGGGGTGVGGNGGVATGGASNLLVRGVLVTADKVTLLANATGGDGGLGSIRGNGGNAATGRIAVESVNRADNPTQRGTLVANTIIALADATGGDGLEIGVASTSGASSFRLLNGDATIGSLNMIITANTIGGDGLGDFVSIINGTATVTGAFNFATADALSALADNGTLTAGTLTLAASNFIKDAVNAPPASVGTFMAASIAVTSGSDIIVDANLVADSSITLNALGLMEVRNLTAGGDVILGAGGSITAGNVFGDYVSLSAGGPVLTGDISAAMFGIDIVSGGTLTTGSLTARQTITLFADGNMSLGSVTSLDESLDASSFGSITTGDIDVGDSVDLDAFGDLSTGDITGVSAELYADGNIDIGNANLSEYIDVEAVGSLTAGDLSAGDSIGLSSTLALVAGDLSAGIVDPSSAFDAEHSITAVSETSVELGNLNALGWIGIASLGSIDAGSITSGNDVLLAADGPINVGAIQFGSGNRLLIAGSGVVAYGETGEDDFDRSLVFAAVDDGGGVATGGSVTIGGPIVGGTADLLAGQNLNLGAVNLGGRLKAEAGGSLTSGAISTIDQISLVAGGDLGTGNVSSSLGSIEAVAIGNASLGSVTADGNIELFADGTLSAANLFAGSSVTVQTAGSATLGNVTAATINIASSAGSVGTGILNATETGINIGAMGNIATGDATAAQYYLASAGGDITGGNLSVGGEIDFAAGDDIAVGTIAAGLVDFNAAGDALIGNANVTQWLDIEAGGTLTAGAITAGDSISLNAGGALVAGNLSAGIVAPVADGDAEFNVGVLSSTSVTLGNVEAREWVGIASAGTVNAGTIEAGNDVLIMADGNVQTGAVSTGSDSRLLVAGFDMVDVGGGDGEGFDRSLVFAAVDSGNAVATDGSVTISGPVNARRVDIFAGNNVGVGAMILGDEGRIDAGGLLTLSGDISGFVTLISNDIDVAVGASIDEAQLVSRNAQGTFIGDGLAGATGYRLSNAEFNRFGALDIAADIGRGAGSTMTIGDLTVASSGSGDWSFEFDDGDFDDGSDLQGTIRIVGDVRFTGMGAVDSDGGWVAFNSRYFQVDAATGSLSLEAAPGVLGGGIGIKAQHVAVAEGAILDKLANDPAYAGLADDLARPTATSVPGGVIRAGLIEIELGAPGEAGPNPIGAPTYSIYVQNSGTAATRAGFRAGEATVEIAEGSPTAPIALIVNGQIVTSDTTLTGVAVRDALMADDDPARFTANSSINGCALTGVCVTQVIPPVDPVPDIATKIVLIAAPTSDDQPFGNEEAIEDNEEGGGDEGAASPIQPPPPLFNTKPLEQSGETDEPVAGGGNPALTGNGSCDAPADGDNCDGDEEDK